MLPPSQDRVNFMFQLYDMAKAKEDHSERVAKASAINADIAKIFDAVVEANKVLQVCIRSNSL